MSIRTGPSTRIAGFLLFILLPISSAQAEEVLFTRGKQLYADEDYESASEVFEELVEKAPSLSDYHHWLGKAYGRVAERSNWFTAVRLAKRTQWSFEQAVELDPEDHDYHRQMGDLYNEEDPDAAEKWYRSALELEPNDVFALNNLGMVLERTGKTRQARTAYKAALLLDPTFEAAKTNVYDSIGPDIDFPRGMRRLFLGIVGFIALILGPAIGIGIAEAEVEAAGIIFGQQTLFEALHGEGDSAAGSDGIQ